MINFNKIAPCALSILMAISTMLLPLISTNAFAKDDSSPTFCKDGYEYVETVGKCYKKCQDGWERNPETNRCRKIRAEKTSEETVEKIPEETVAPAGNAKEKQNEVPSSNSTGGTSSSVSNSSSSKGETSTAPEETPSCKDGYEYVASAGKCYKACAEGQVRNPETNRCKKAATKSDSEAGSSGGDSKTSNASNNESSSSNKTCKEGYEYVASAGKCYKACEDGQVRNPETNRCKKDTASSKKGSTSSSSKSSSKKTNDGADYAVDVPNTGSTTSFVAIGSVIALVVAGLVFIIFQYRVEIQQFTKKCFKKFKKS